MHGLINRSLQCFLRDTYGVSTWAEVARVSNLGFDTFEALHTYDDALTEAVINAASQHLVRSREAVLEDLGNYLVSHPNADGLRRLLRFGGVTFVDFLHSLEDLSGRGRMAVPDIDLPDLALFSDDDDHFLLFCGNSIDGSGYVMLGLLRAMADDYGTLVLLEHQGTKDRAEVISIKVLEQGFSAGRCFELAARVR